MKLAAVTGASRGIGREIALRFAREGFTVLAIARDQAALSTLGPQVKPIEADLADARAVDVLAAALAQEPLDVLVNNAGIAMSAPIHKTSDADWSRVMAINGTAPFALCRAVIPKMAG